MIVSFVAVLKRERVKKRFFFFGVLRLAQTPEPGLKKKFPILSGKSAGTTEPDYFNPPVLQSYYSPDSPRS